jgi:hypothetical protein
MKRNKSLLPQVNNDTMWNVHHRIKDQSDRQFFKREMKAIRKENALVADFIARWANDPNISKSARGYAAFCGILVYRLLASQAEANHMNEELGM